jgi:hypothetical protein
MTRARGGVTTLATAWFVLKLKGYTPEESDILREVNQVVLEVGQRAGLVLVDAYGARRQLDLPHVLPRFGMLPDCLIEFVLSFASTECASQSLWGVGSYARQALGGHRASTRR